MQASFRSALGHARSDQRVAILRQVGVHGSISQAARAAGVSYKAAWQAIEMLTALAGVPLVSKVVGGAGGGGAVLTPAGHQLLAAAQSMDAARGAVLARFSSQAGSEQRPQLAVQTSMRNQVPCVVHSVHVHGAIARVFLNLYQEAVAAIDDPAWVARITRESVQLLGLEEGVRVQALCKATAVAVVRAPPVSSGAVFERCLPSTGSDAQCLLTGRATKLVRGALGDEVSVELWAHHKATGLHMVGFAAANSRLRVGSMVTLSVQESALVLATTGD